MLHFNIRRIFQVCDSKFRLFLIKSSNLKFYLNRRTKMELILEHHQNYFQ